MNLILGGSGRVGSTIIEALIANEPVTAAIRNKSSVKELRGKGVKVKIADYLENEELKEAFKGIETAFLMTPENMKSPDIFEENKLLLQNYKNGIQAHHVQKIVGLSSMGAQHNRDTGNLLLSHNLEKLDSATLKTRIFLRPAYYFSNWLHYLPLIQKEGILPSFFPSDLKIPMVSPKDVGHFAAELIKNNKLDSQTIALEGPESYS